MYPTLFLTNRLRTRLKAPFGTPIYGPEHQVTEEFNKIIKSNPGKKLITVGDIVSQSFDSDIKIYDQRNRRNTPVRINHETMNLKNPPSSINTEAWETLETALKSKKKERIRVDGEEDMLVLPLMILANHNTIIVYGLPDKGIAYIIPDSSIKNEAKTILDAMKQTRFKKTILGGTFDRLHKGHKSLLNISPYYTESLLIGVTSNTMASKKPYPENLEPMDTRIKSLESHLKSINIQYEIATIDDIYGPAKDDPDADSIILTEETFENGKKLNEERKKQGQSELEYIILPYVLGPDDMKISSARLRKNECYL